LAAAPPQPRRPPQVPRRLRWRPGSRWLPLQGAGRADGAPAPPGRRRGASHRYGVCYGCAHPVVKGASSNLFAWASTRLRFANTWHHRLRTISVLRRARRNGMSALQRLRDKRLDSQARVRLRHPRASPACWPALAHEPSVRASERNAVAFAANQGPCHPAGASPFSLSPTLFCSPEQECAFNGAPGQRWPRGPPLPPPPRAAARAPTFGGARGASRGGGGFGGGTPPAVVALGRARAPLVVVPAALAATRPQEPRTPPSQPHRDILILGYLPGVFRRLATTAPLSLHDSFTLQALVVPRSSEA
jgi:hypothetical protein